MKKKIMLDFVAVITASILVMVGLFVAVTHNMFERRIADSLDMNAQVLLAAMDNGEQGVLDAVASGRLSEERIDDSLERIVRTKLAWEDGSLGA